MHKQFKQDIAKKDILGKLYGIILVAETIKIKFCLVAANAFFISEKIDILDSVVSTEGSGCGYNKNEGFPQIFISHTYTCGLNAGSYGGRGGIGISYTEDVVECIKSSSLRMSTYGDALFPL